ncbi:KH domain-containing, RNA-binding, signal transduction-associated protein 3 [Pteropus alecto]|uniref:KH domain-containing, RNA-binding, signal transduction-associated protein 3 n=1 Tax=Pteropus alecto TaxID=9402 RepID=L5KJB2_PTEAL|nr:KH domain-containing, RNA-binding, signal transduction-associated protein 3 [Pteropus alecto]
MEEKYLPELMAEKDSLDPSFTHALRLVNQEIEKFQKGEGKDEEKYIDVVINKNMKLGQKVLIPVKQFPKFNFVGKLLGPRGNSLKRLQEETLTKMSILGKGSMRDKAKEEELRKSGEAKYFHLNDDLHVLIEVFAPPAEAYARMGHALEEIKKFLIPDYNDEIRQAQLQELTYLNGGSENADVPVARGKTALRPRGTPAPAITRGRGGATARPVGVGVPRGTPTSRGVLSTRGPVSRGRGLLTPRARGVPPAGYRPPPPPPSQEAYGDYVSEGVRRQLWRSDWRSPYVRWGVAPSILCHLPSALSTPPRFSGMYRVKKHVSCQISPWCQSYEKRKRNNLFH